MGLIAAGLGLIAFRARERLRSLEGWRTTSLRDVRGGSAASTGVVTEGRIDGRRIDLELEDDDARAWVRGDRYDMDPGLRYLDAPEDREEYPDELPERVRTGLRVYVRGPARVEGGGVVFEATDEDCVEVSLEPPEETRRSVQRSARIAGVLALLYAGGAAFLTWAAYTHFGWG
jgi:hypothetical protein